MSVLKLGVPSKGRLMDKTFDWFAERGIEMRRAGGTGIRRPGQMGSRDVDLVLLSAGEIPRDLAAGAHSPGGDGAATWCANASRHGRTWCASCSRWASATPI